MQHGIGKQPDARHDLFATFNRAGRALVNCHEWSWRRTYTDLVAVADQAYIELPDDYGRYQKATVQSNGGLGEIIVSELADIMALRASGSVGVSSRVYVYFPSYTPRVNLEVARRARVELYPTPSEAGSPTITLAYMAKWVDCPSADKNRTPPIPEEFEEALIDIARAFAATLENSDPNFPAPMPEVRNFPSVQRLMVEDGGRNGDVQMRGGAGSRPRYTEPGTDDREITTISI